MTLAGTFVRSGKVRDLYELDADRLVLVASDRLSAFDVVLPTPIPDKGRVLTGLSRFWFAETRPLVPNHLLSTDPTELGADAAEVADLRGRTMICRRAQVLPGRGHRPRLRRRIGLERLPADRRDLRASASRPTCARATGCRSRS